MTLIHDHMQISSTPLDTVSLVDLRNELDYLQRASVDPARVRVEQYQDIIEGALSARIQALRSAIDMRKYTEQCPQCDEECIGRKEGNFIVFNCPNCAHVWRE